LRLTSPETLQIGFGSIKVFGNADNGQSEIVLY
jgi:hypothetical protein